MPRGLVIGTAQAAHDALVGRELVGTGVILQVIAHRGPGLLLDLARDYSVDLREAAIIGDALSDMEAGQAVGCQTILVLTGRGREQLEEAHRTGRNGFSVAPSLDGAIEALLGASQSR